MRQLKDSVVVSAGILSGSANHWSYMTEAFEGYCPVRINRVVPFGRLADGRNGLPVALNQELTGAHA